MKRSIIILMFSFIAINAIAQYAPKKKYPAHPAHPAAATHPAPVVVKQKTDDYSVLNKNFLDPGVGLGTYYQGLPFGVSFEHGFTDEISGGVFVDYSGYNSNDFYKLNIIYGGVRASYHFAKLFNVTNPNFDPYAGVSLGYYSVNYSYPGSGGDIHVDDPYSSNVLFGVHAGVRYMLSKNVGVFGEVGYGVAAIQLGASFKF